MNKTIEMFYFREFYYFFFLFVIIFKHFKMVSKLYIYYYCNYYTRNLYRKWIINVKYKIYYMKLTHSIYFIITDHSIHYDILFIFLDGSFIYNIYIFNIFYVYLCECINSNSCNLILRLIIRTQIIGRTFISIYTYILYVQFKMKNRYAKLFWWYNIIII